MSAPDADKQSYRVTRPGWVAGKRRALDEVIEMTPSQAKYETSIEPVKPARNKTSKGD